MASVFPAALLFAVVQAGTEFLPVSSSGHLFILSALLGVNADPFLVAVNLHVATAMAAVVYYRREFKMMAGGFRRPGANRGFVKRYAAAQCVTLVVAGGLALLLTQSAGHPWLKPFWLTGALMLINGGVLLSAPRRVLDRADDSLPPLTWRLAFWVGLAQGISALPGLSRSGLTLVAGLRGGLSPDHAASLSFLLAPPVIIVGAVYWTARGWGQIGPWFSSWETVGLALLVAVTGFAVGLLALRWVVSWVRSERTRWFAPWSLAVGAAALATAVW